MANQPATQLPTYFGIQHLGRLEGARTVVFDSETTGLRPVKGGLRLLQFAAESYCIVVVDCFELTAEEWVQLRKFFAEPRDWFAHNAVFDLGWLQEQGLYPQGHVSCTMLASKLLTNGLPNLKHGLGAVVERYLGKQLDKELQRSDWSTPTLTTEQLAYAAADVQALVDLVPVLKRRLTAAYLDNAFNLECLALQPMAQMQRTGLPFSRERLVALQESLEQDIAKYGQQFVEELDAALPEEHKLPRDIDGTFNLRAHAEGSVRLGTKRLAGFNLNSPKQLLDKFTVLLGSVPKESAGKPSVSRKALRAYAADHTVVQTYLSWKRSEKRRQMVVALLEHQQEDGFIKAGYMQLGADTGRMSCVKPNLQQVPRDKGFRQAAEAPEGWSFVCADFGQMELRLAAAFAKDTTMIKAFQDNEDLHTLTAAAIYGGEVDDAKEMKQRRQVAKSANFGLLYGAGANGLREYAGSMGITMTIDEAQQIRDTFHSTYRGVDAWQRANAQAADRSKGDKWAFIRIPNSELRRYLPGEMNRVTVRCNTPVQGAGAAILKHSLGKLWPKLRAAGEEVVKLAAVVHDEILLLVREGCEEEWMGVLQQVMESSESIWLGSIPPLAEASTGKTWADAK
jgi:DNA polymerase I-like protein with 3'-5' exonuclease and polymerase domains